jgi:hypothetical protein
MQTPAAAIPKEPVFSPGVILPSTRLLNQVHSNSPTTLFLLALEGRTDHEESFPSEALFLTSNAVHSGSNQMILSIRTQRAVRSGQELARHPEKVVHQRTGTLRVPDQTEWKICHRFSQLPKRDPCGLPSQVQRREQADSNAGPNQLKQASALSIKTVFAGSKPV